MDRVMTKLTVFFEEPFWVGVFEKTWDEKVSVSKFTFGTEPKDYEIYHFIQEKYYDIQFSPAVSTVTKNVKYNPKKMMRLVKKQVSEKGIGTKSQQALKLQHEEQKQVRKAVSKEQKEARQEYLFALKQHGIMPFPTSIPVSFLPISLNSYTQM